MKPTGSGSTKRYGSYEKMERSLQSSPGIAIRQCSYVNERMNQKPVRNAMICQNQLKLEIFEFFGVASGE
jgi:hypothetical protein